MTPPLAALFVGLLSLYAALGLLFAVPFAWRGVERVDPEARGTSWGFRLLVIPGAVVFWPLLLVRWAAGSVAPPVETNAHRRLARARRAS